MDKENNLLLKKKLKELKTSKLQQSENNERKRIVENIDDFDGKYRFANDVEKKNK